MVIFIYKLSNYSYNKGNIENSKDKIYETNNGYTASGGLIGYFVHGSYENLSVIEDSYNIGTVSGGMIAGGLVGYSYISANILINRSYNLADIFGNTQIKEKGMYTGLVGYISESKVTILNSYNKGNLDNSKSQNNNAMAGGFTGHLWESNAIVINSYNIGDLISTSYAGGVLGYTFNKDSKLTVNNVYTLGNYSATTINGIAYITGANININNAYYNSKITGTAGSTPLEENFIKSQSFVNQLNDNIKTINLEEIDPVLKDYTLVNWKLGNDGYPTLDF